MFIDYVFGVFKIRNAKEVRRFPDFVVILADFHEICSDFPRFSRKTLQLLEIYQFQGNVIMI